MPEQVSDQEFRAVLSRLAAGVVLLTAHDPDEGLSGTDLGMTVTAFLSVSLEPPLVLVSVHHGSHMSPLLAERRVWAASLLAEGQHEVADRFAVKHQAGDWPRFDDIPHVRGDSSRAPLIGGALATLECRTEQTVQAGDHALVVGRVLATSLPSADAGPLTYFCGHYRWMG
ncbi:flavin reductase family protein [Streptomyces mesophilus]|uniref:flavin reductase family protein n=1 Tax=Streptomyces mesophilus TaxID=1775132 RepID=UPI00332CE9F7